jgi:hypothetical protein
MNAEVEPSSSHRGHFFDQVDPCERQVDGNTFTINVSLPERLTPERASHTIHKDPSNTDMASREQSFRGASFTTTGSSEQWPVICNCESIAAKNRPHVYVFCRRLRWDLIQ